MFCKSAEAERNSEGCPAWIPHGLSQNKMANGKHVYIKFYKCLLRKLAYVLTPVSTLYCHSTYCISKT